MASNTAKKAPVVRLPPKSNYELVLARGSQLAVIFIALIVFIVALDAGEFILAPISLAVVIGLMFGPVATRAERQGLPPALSALLVVVLFLVVVGGLVFALAAPISLWIGRVPQIWAQLQAQLAQWKEPLEMLRGARDELREFTGGSGMPVTVDDGSAVENMAAFAPTLVGQVLLFLTSLYFFVATRHQTRAAVLKVCLNRRLRWRVAHIFRDVERMVSSYLLSITLIYVGEGIVVGAGLYLIGLPSAALWGTMAAFLNYIPFVGPAVMTIVLFAVGLAAFDTLGGSLVPPLIFLAVNAIEAQFVTPLVIGRTMTLNPFIVLLALAFWIWLWGALGGFIAIPALLIAIAIARHIIPGMSWLMDDGRPGAG
jgi:predicted PurR-regulated permease PerM